MKNPILFTLQNIKFKEDLETFLRSTNVVDIALKNLYLEKGSFQNRELSLIRTASEVYETKLFNKKAFDLFLNKDVKHLKELIFNATEFNTGNGFRFTKSQNPKAVVGNSNFSIDKDLAKDIRLSDIVAASSCFPGGFEPLRFPDDFHLPSDTLAKIHNDQNFKEPLPLMDGGIYDNQGIEGILLAAKRKNTNIDFVLVSDTNQRQEPLFEYPVGKRSGQLKLIDLVYLLVLLNASSLVTIVVILYYLYSDLSMMINTNVFKLAFLYLMPLVLSISVVCILTWLGFKLLSGLDVKMGGVHFNLQSVIQNLTISDTFSIGKSRFESLVAMSSSVFLKRIRALLFKSLASDEKYKDKHFFNLIYDMNPDYKRTIYETESWLKPCELLKQLSENAEKMPTTLWFEDENQLKTLVFCGEATTCHNLLVYLHRQYSAQITDPNSGVYSLYKRAKDIWERVNKEEHIRDTRNISLKWEYANQKEFNK